MGVRLILGRAGSGKTYSCLEAIRARLADALNEGPRLILLVPEQAALQMERALLADERLAGLGRCDVVSFRRLAHRILQRVGGGMPGVLTPTGRTMVLRSLAARHRGRLREFGAVGLRSGFLDALARAIVELIQEAVPIERLEAAAQQAESGRDPSAARLGDLAVMYRAYLEYLGDRHVDPEGMLDLARARMDVAPWLTGACVWVDGFAGFTRQQVRLLAAQAARSAEMTVSLLVDPEEPRTVEQDGVPDRLSIFSRTQRTMADLQESLRDAGVAIEAPARLSPARPPRFRSPELARLERNLFRARGTHAGGDPPSSAAAAGVRVVQAADRRAEVQAVAREVRRLALDRTAPLRYREIAIIVRDLEPYHDLISSALRERGIPFFIDRRRSVSHHPLVEWVRAALALRGDAATAASAIAPMLKTGLTPLTDGAADALENYVLAHGLLRVAAWRGDDWTMPVRPHDRDDEPLPTERQMLAEINAARRAIAEAIGDWWRADDASARTTATCRAQATELMALSKRMNVAARLADWSDAAQRRGDADESQEHTQVWTELVRLLDELVAALGDEPLTHGEFREIVEAGLAGLDVGLVPPTIDQVLVSQIERSRHPPIRAAFLIGFSDGVFPRVASEDDLLGDAERALLEAQGATIRGGRATRLLDERMLAYIAVTRPSERLWISFPIADESGRPMSPSPYLPYVRAALGDSCPPIAVVQAGSAEPDSCDTPGEVAAALGMALRRIAVCGESPASLGDTDMRWLRLYEAARRDPRLHPALQRSLPALAPPEQATLDVAAITALYGRQKPMSVSRIEAFAQCPYRYFAHYELRLRERATAEPDVRVLGSLSHHVLEQFVNDLIESNERLSDLSDTELADRLTRIADAAALVHAQRVGGDESEPQRLARQITRELPPAVQAQRRLAEGGLEPAAVERTFGLHGEDALPPLRLRTPKGRDVVFRGRVDRIDLHRAASGIDAYVFDYKSARSQRLSLDHVLHGVALQLVSYLLVLRDHPAAIGGRPVRPVGAFYVPLRAALQAVDHPCKAEAADFDPLKPYQPRGVIDFDGLLRLEPQLREGGRSRRFSAHVKKGGGLGNEDTTDTLTSENFTTLLDFVRRKLGELTDALLDGDIRIAPARIGNELACTHCEFRAVCRFEYASGFARVLPRRGRKAAMDEMAGRTPRPLSSDTDADAGDDA